MATIITLHGTNATGPEEGDRWWQRGSAFERDIRKYVEGEDGTLTYAPLVWTGLNSEVARREAAGKLVRRIDELEARGEKYCVIGHSHGGSVISHALLVCASRQSALPRLSRWMTVGTPFIAPQKAWMLFPRLGVIGQSAYLTFMALFLIFAIPSLFMGWKAVIFFSQTHPISIFFGTATPLAIVYTSMLYFNARKLHHHRPANQKLAREMFGARWRAYWHPDDEAICGLRSMGGLNLAIFEQQFAVPLITFLTLVAIPFGLVGFVLFNVEVLGTGSGGAPFAMGPTAPPKWTPARLSGDAVFWLLITSILGALLYVASLLITYLATRLAKLFSGRISDLLNHTANSQLRRRGFGYDAPGERGTGAEHYPAWLCQPFPNLPNDLAAEVAAISDEAAASSLTKFRSALSDLTFAEPGDRQLSIDAYLSWDELIHTAYFSVERFRKLLAYGIATADGFRPSPILAADPEFGLLQRWNASLSRTARDVEPLGGPEIQSAVPA